MSVTIDSSESVYVVFFLIQSLTKSLNPHCFMIRKKKYFKMFQKFHYGRDKTYCSYHHPQQALALWPLYDVVNEVPIPHKENHTVCSMYCNV